MFDLLATYRLEFAIAWGLLFLADIATTEIFLTIKGDVELNPVAAGLQKLSPAFWPELIIVLLAPVAVALWLLFPAGLVVPGLIELVAVVNNVALIQRTKGK